MKTMGQRLRELRLARGESLQQAAAPSGCSKAHLWQLERGMTDNPTLGMLRSLAQHYGVTIGYIIDGETLAAVAPTAEPILLLSGLADDDPRWLQYLEQRGWQPMPD